jgi:hypothetical protein
MTSPENPEIVPSLKQAIANEIGRDPTLIPEHGVKLEVATKEYAEPMAALYKSAFDRGDYFASRYDSPEEQIFSPDWLAQDLQEPDHIRFVFTDHERQLLGATAFFHDSDSEAGPLMTSDATQIDHAGRGMRIMDYFFKRIVPVIEASGAGLATDFVLTPESKGLRRTLQTDLGMVAIGIHPHALHHRELGITRSEISAIKYRELAPKSAQILPFFEPLYRIVQSQLPSLPEPEIIQSRPQITESMVIECESEIVKTVSGADPQSQLEALEAGYLPVEFDPGGNQFKVAQYPRKSPDLDFILTNEQVQANKFLITYMNDVLFATYRPD